MVKLSAIGAGEKIGRDVVGAWHLAAEQAVRDSGMAWTILRPSSFASNALRWVDAADQGQPVPDLTGPGRQGIVDPYDVAAVAVETLLSSAHVGTVYTLTGPELLTMTEQVDCLSRVAGRRVSTVAVSLECCGLATGDRCPACGRWPVSVESGAGRGYGDGVGLHGPSPPTDDGYHGGRIRIHGGRSLDGVEHQK